MQTASAKINYLCSTIAVANYVIKSFKKANAKLSKGKLNNVLAYAYIKHIIETGNALTCESLMLMHFGLIFESIYKIFESLSCSEDIGPRNYTATEIELGIKLRERVLEKEISDENALSYVKALLDNCIALFLDKSDQESAQVILAENNLWHYLAYVNCGGPHLVQDFAEIEPAFIYSIKGKLSLT